MTNFLKAFGGAGIAIHLIEYVVEHLTGDHEGSMMHAISAAIIYVGVVILQAVAVEQPQEQTRQVNEASEDIDFVWPNRPWRRKVSS